MLKVNDIRNIFIDKLKNKQFVSVNRESSMTSLVGSTTVEIINAAFIADENSIFGSPNNDYIKREEQWYNSMSLNVNDIPGGAPAIWKTVADKDGFINSNYGWTCFSPDNGNQYKNVINELKNNPESRRAVIIYTRPSMWKDYNYNGRSDFMCTNTVQYVVRDGKVNSIVSMRSNDAWAGYRNDYAWQKHMLEKISTDINYEVGNIYWNAGSLHIYSRHFYLVDHYSKTNEISITKNEYLNKYKDSIFC